ncbi:hypothetical protein BDV95DRAFT_595280 [Massariosphaeria phaeospora]|uniref:Uncharacterized protein n=1 Tax=Massariosphaeria phaeospora TaxID=100035 RepID=A0A7C8MMG6_9PLEO|nr:hypothetical protein BDV95DRAFT_595280 [Massariosphaeria phaeospora]
MREDHPATTLIKKPFCGEQRFDSNGGVDTNATTNFLDHVMREELSRNYTPIKKSFIPPARDEFLKADGNQRYSSKQSDVETSDCRYATQGVTGCRHVGSQTAQSAHSRSLRSSSRSMVSGGTSDIVPRTARNHREQAHRSDGGELGVLTSGEGSLGLDRRS